MSIIKETISNSIEKLIYDGKAAAFSGTVIVINPNEKGWVIFDCTQDSRISKGLSNVSNKLNISVSLEKFYCKPNENVDINIFKEIGIDKPCNVVVEIFLSKKTRLFGKITKVLNTQLSGYGTIVQDKKLIQDEIIQNTKSSLQMGSSTFDLDTKNKEYKKGGQHQPFSQSSNQLTIEEETFNILKTVIKDSLKEVNENLLKLITVVTDLSTIVKNLGMNIEKYVEYKKIEEVSVKKDIQPTKHIENNENISIEELQKNIISTNVEGTISNHIVNENVDENDNENMNKIDE
jgi:hypothetical protein